MKLRMVVYSFIAGIIFLYGGTARAEKMFVLYGFKIGQKTDAAFSELGKPTKTYNFSDGFTSFAFMKGDHYIIIETDASRPDMIWGIQLSGKKNPVHRGLGEVNMGDPVEKAIKTLGRPDSSEFAVDEITNKELRHIKRYSYYKKSNFSIESENGKVSSVKIVYNGPVEPYPEFDGWRLTREIQKGDPYAVCSLISGEVTLIEKGRGKHPGKSLLSEILPGGTLHSILYNRDYGIGTVTGKDVTYSALRLYADRNVGMPVVVERGGRKYEMVFMKSFEGWMLKEITIIK